MPKKGQGACKGGVTEGDTVNVPIQKEGDTRLVLTVRASELTLDRGDVKASATIEFTVKRTDAKGRKQIGLSHALVDNACEALNTKVYTIDVGTPPQKAVRLWTVCFKRRVKKFIDGTEVRDWRRDCFVPDDLKEAFALRRDVNNLEAVAGRYVVDSPYQPRLLPDAHMYKCDVTNFETQIGFNFGAWTMEEAWNNARDQVIANGATGLNDMEDARFFAWLPDNHKENARNSLKHRWIGWTEGAVVDDRLVPTRRRNSR